MGGMDSRLPRKKKKKPLNVSPHRTWCYRLVIQLLERMKQENYKCEASLDNLVFKRRGLGMC